jgi:hypothetical protein
MRVTVTLKRIGGDEPTLVRFNQYLSKPFEESVSQPRATTGFLAI